MPKKEKDISFYDFLYEDKQRIPFYFSQIFEGLTTGIETLEESKKSRNIEPSLGASKSYLRYEKTSEVIKSSKEFKEPLDIITLKLLEEIDISKLPSFEKAEEGQLFLEKGSFYLVSKEMLKSLYSWFTEILNRIHIAKNPKKKYEEINKIATLFQMNTKDVEFLADQIELLIPFIKNVEFETFIIFITENNQKLLGIIKEENLRDSLNSYYLKYGGKFIPNTYLVGIKDYYAQAILDTSINELVEVFESIKAMAIQVSDYDLMTPLTIFRIVNSS
ncbi:hypothetical protein SAMN06265182_0973 [Persephonella hydrogeniphila]|uniref:Uncharacterized protein n=1 Tax=Persephonella hydrogeniphila TaxID=198703 RepID=A0A285NE19_9AQUI|nr:hypothetical protein [Persephonella hydrogeniphila]SNZ07699.1 hypothetical protein SAMN06265182_0973 [Persephonella hydrogeniphila]